MHFCKKYGFENISNVPCKICESRDLSESVYNPIKGLWFCMKEDKEERTVTHSFCTQVGLPFHNHKIWTSVVYHLSTYEWMGMKEKKVLFASSASCFDLPRELVKIWQNIYDLCVTTKFFNKPSSYIIFLRFDIVI